MLTIEGGREGGREEGEQLYEMPAGLWICRTYSRSSTVAMADSWAVVSSGPSSISSFSPDVYARPSPTGVGLPGETGRNRVAIVSLLSGLTAKEERAKEEYNDRGVGGRVKGV